LWLCPNPYKEFRTDNRRRSGGLLFKTCCNTKSYWIYAENFPDNAPNYAMPSIEDCYSVAVFSILTGIHCVLFPHLFLPPLTSVAILELLLEFHTPGYVYALTTSLEHPGKQSWIIVPLVGLVLLAAYNLACRRYKKAADLSLSVGFAAATLSRMLACFGQHWGPNWLTESSKRTDHGWAMIEMMLCPMVIYFFMIKDVSTSWKYTNVDSNF
jgi:hypothetical protein